MKPPLHHKNEKTWSERRKAVSTEAWEQVFDILFRKHLIFDVDPDCYKEEIFFKNKKELE